MTDARGPRRAPDEQPSHPTLAAALLMVGVVLLIVAISLVGALGAR